MNKRLTEVQIQMSKLKRLLPLLSSQILEEGVEVEVEKGELEAIEMAADNF
jgi:hypothetical protein